MITDPYKVLGVSPSASNDEIKKTYRELSRKYHPDSYVDNPLADLAEEKFKEIQDAYKQIMDQREHGYSNQSYQDTSSYGGQNYYQQNSYSEANYQESEEMRKIYSMIMMKRFRESLNELARVPERGARWHYYNAIAYAGLGNIITAMGHAKQAVALDPANPEYSQFLRQLQMNTRNYQRQGGGMSGNNDELCDMCCKLWAADTCCECLGGDLCSCI